MHAWQMQKVPVELGQGNEAGCSTALAAVVHSMSVVFLQCSGYGAGLTASRQSLSMSHRCCIPHICSTCAGWSHTL